MDKGTLTRRKFLSLAALGTMSSVLSACGGAAPASPTPTQKALAVDAAPTPTRETAASGESEVTRAKSLVLMWNGSAPGIGSPYADGFNHQMGTMALHEPLYFFSSFANKTIPWLADGDPQYSSDFTEVTIKTRAGAEWSDGVAFGAKDVAFTLNMLRDTKNVSRPFASDVNKWVKDATAADDTTVKISFNQPAPRFVFDFLAFKFDLGIFFVPEHIFKDQPTIASFQFYDTTKGWPITTGPYKITDWTEKQMLLNLRPDWWAAKISFAELPKVEWISTIPFANEAAAAQAAINNEIDSSLDLRPPMIKKVVESNTKIITHTGREKPYGYTDWWPNSLWFNCSEEPFNDSEIRHAINHAISREKIVAVAYEGSGKSTDLPFPEFPSLAQYFQAAKPLLEKYPTNDFDLGKTTQIMTTKGYTKNDQGLWTDAKGKQIDMPIAGFDIFSDYGPVLADQLREAGFNASFEAKPDSYNKMDDGTANAFLFGHGGAIADVYPTLDLFHSRHSRPTGKTGGITTRWKNDEYDKLVDQISLLPVGDPKGLPLYLQALELYLKEKPELPIVQWLHRIPMNTTYWEGWPTAEDPYVNGAFWAKTFPLILHRLKPSVG